MKKSSLIAVVDQSPQAVGVHDKAAWLGIFANDHRVEDPVGSPAHIGDASLGNSALSKFYETFIAPNGIAFEVHKDTVNGSHVVRDLTVHTTMSPTLKLEVSMHLLYELVEEGGAWKIKRLAAHWELMPMMAQVFSNGFSCVPVLSSLTVRMLKNQGVLGMLGFCKAAFTVGEYGKQQLENFCDFVNAKLENRLQEFLKDAESIIVMEDELTLADIMKSDLSIQLKEKRLVAGQFVSASFACTYKQENRSGVMFIEFDKKTRRAKNVRLYCD